ncbi:hypothetical protein PENSPDRAFT_371506 [Peniophora sp. CONT]|nr:hypothetical protein PENSPDRAFT_371506 [Peniophora sp. CONT]
MMDEGQGASHATRTPAHLLEAWTPVTHTGGRLYFFHEEKNIWTGTYLYRRRYYDEVEKCASLLEEGRQMLLDKGLPFPVQYELVIDIDTSEHDENEILWQYYYVDHTTRSIFWLRPHILWKELYAAKGAFSPDHIYHKMQEFYWNHIYYFAAGPCDRIKFFGPDVWRELSSFMDFNMLGTEYHQASDLVARLRINFPVDYMVAPKSNSFHPPAELTEMRMMVETAYEQSVKDVLLPGQLSTVGEHHFSISAPQLDHLGNSSNTDENGRATLYSCPRSTFRATSQQ